MMINLILVSVLTCQADPEIDRSRFLDLMKGLHSDIKDYQLKLDGRVLAVDPLEPKATRKKFKTTYAYRADGTTYMDIFYTYPPDVASPSERQTFTFDPKQQKVLKLVRDPDEKGAARRFDGSVAGTSELVFDGSPERFIELRHWSQFYDRPDALAYQFDGWEDIGGHKCLHISVVLNPDRAADSEPVMDRFWIDMKRGGHTLKRERRYGFKLLFRVQNIKLEEFTIPGGKKIWFPVHGEFESFNPHDRLRGEELSDAPVLRDTYDVIKDSLLVNQGIPDSRFSVFAKDPVEKGQTNGALPASAVNARKQDLPNRTPIGIFEGHADIGTVLHAGSVVYDTDKRSYSIVGSGENMWFTNDAFHYAWKKATGDLALEADVSFVGAGTDPHRKACLMIRQGLEPDAAYVDIALHGDGLTSLQFRESRGAATHEVQANITAPKRLRLEKRGKYVTMSLAADGRNLAFSGAAVRIPFDETFYVGLGVCSHNKDVSETAVFSKVELGPLPSAPDRPVLYSTLETQTMSSTDRRVVHVTPSRIEAPNWSRDGRTLIYNSGGRLYRIPATGGEPQPIDTGFATRCNNDHGVSPDGTTLVISDQSQEDRRSRIYTLPIAGGTPKLITKTGPSYWHGWSPDGKTLAYCAERRGEYDVYTIPADGGDETRLTTADGLDDGPEYSPDGKTIYFNSDRTGRMQIWRMQPDGTKQEQLTDDAFNNWFPHPSPDGRSLVFLSYEKDVTGHPENKDVTLRRMTLETKKIDVLGRLFGGQGTVNVPCWSPDGRKIAFVTYQLLP